MYLIPNDTLQITVENISIEKQYQEFSKAGLPALSKPIGNNGLAST